MQVSGFLEMFDERGSVGAFVDSSCPCTIEMQETRVISVRAQPNQYKGFAL